MMHVGNADCTKHCGKWLVTTNEYKGKMIYMKLSLLSLGMKI